MSGMDMANQARIDDQISAGQRIRALEWNVRRLLGREGLDWEEPPADTGTPPGVMAALQSGNVIEAIKAYREATGVGLAEAKDAVERLRTGG
jgi:ribosomal protein L7/L12